MRHDSSSAVRGLLIFKLNNCSVLQRSLVKVLHTAKTGQEKKNPEVVA